jgi:hypothetical protein
MGFAVAVWAICGALIGIGRQFMDMDATLILHAVGAPLGSTFFAAVYFRNFAFTTPLVTAAVFVGASLTLDVLVVAMLIEKSFEMFTSVLGVWIPQALIFSAAFLTGHWMTSHGNARG